MSGNPYGFIPPARRRRRAWVAPVLAVVLAAVVALGLLDLAAYALTGIPILAVW